MVTQLRSISDGTHPVGLLTTANYALNPGFSVGDPTQTFNPRVNLCPTPSFETSTGTWVAGGATIAQDAGNPFIGSFALKITGNSASTTTTYVPISGIAAGQAYNASVYLYLPTFLGTTVTPIGIQWFQGATPLTSVSATAVSSNSNYTRYNIQGTAPAGADNARVFTSAGVNGGSYWIDAVLFEQTSALGAYFDGQTDLTVTRTNLCPNPRFANGLSFWTAAGTFSPTLSVSTTRSLFGKQSMLITWIAGGGSPNAQFSFTTVVGVQYSLSVYVYVPSGSSPVTLAASGIAGGTTSTVYDDWQRLTRTFIATGTLHAVNIIEVQATPGTCYVSGVLVEASGAAGDYFDGDIPNIGTVGITNSWASTPSSSVSVQRAPTASLSWNGTVGNSSSTRVVLSPKYWTASNAEVTRDATLAQFGSYCARIKPTLTSAIPKMSQTFSVIDSTNYSISFFANIPATISGGGISVEFSCFDSTNTLISLTIVPLLQSGAPTVGFIRLATTQLTPAGTTTMTVSIRPTVQPTLLTDIFYVDSFRFEQADSASASFIDGNFSGYTWSGIPGESTTIQTEFPDALKFFGTFAYDTPVVVPVGNIPIAARSKVLPTSWPSVPLTD